jgi:cytochrome bd-type quinol oxidase subunit 2
MQARTVEGEKRRGIVWLVIGVFVLALMFGAWWLVATTNSEGHHDAQLLPFLALIPLLIGVYHLVWSRFLRHT